MQYVKIIFSNVSTEVSELLIAMLADAGYDGFEESESSLLAYIEQPRYHKDEVEAIAGRAGIDFETELIPAQNWNALWESNFQPVVIPGLCTIRAHFHDIQVETPYDIQITPKMSFGTGHHATTQLMMQTMQEMDLKGHTALDFGTGTGVLAILAEMMGAGAIAAIDNDEWSVENSIENCERNSCRNISIARGSLDEIPMQQFDVILANINRHILLQYMPGLYERLKTGGKLLMSGLLVDDRDIITNAATAQGFRFKQYKEQSNWIALLFEK